MKKPKLTLKIEETDSGATPGVVAAVFEGKRLLLCSTSAASADVDHRCSEWQFPHSV